MGRALNVAHDEYDDDEKLMNHLGDDTHLYPMDHGTESSRSPSRESSPSPSNPGTPGADGRRRGQRKRRHTTTPDRSNHTGRRVQKRKSSQNPQGRGRRKRV